MEAAVTASVEIASAQNAALMKAAVVAPSLNAITRLSAQLHINQAGGVS